MEKIENDDTTIIDSNLADDFEVIKIKKDCKFNINYV